MFRYYILTIIIVLGTWYHTASRLQVYKGIRGSDVSTVLQERERVSSSPKATGSDPFKRVPFQVDLLRVSQAGNLPEFGSTYHLLRKAKMISEKGNRKTQVVKRRSSTESSQAVARSSLVWVVGLSFQESICRYTPGFYKQEQFASRRG